MVVTTPRLLDARRAAYGQEEAGDAGMGKRQSDALAPSKRNTSGGGGGSNSSRPCEQWIDS